jgi:hypothetical protein
MHAVNKVAVYWLNGGRRLNMGGRMAGPADNVRRVRVTRHRWSN